MIRRDDNESGRFWLERERAVADEERKRVRFVLGFAFLGMVVLVRVRCWLLVRALWQRLVEFGVPGWPCC